MKKQPRNNSKKPRTSWGAVAPWYHETVEKEGSYQKELILPNVLRLVDPKPGMHILDLACGSGFFSHAFAQKGAQVTGVDISTELIALAKKESSRNIVFHVARANHLPFLKNGSIDAVVMVLALQNIQEVQETLKECARVLKAGGRSITVLNHPAFRIPGSSSWRFDMEQGVQYREIESYLSESKAEIVMHPGEKKSAKTISFHRPLQFYFKALHKAGFAVTRLEEWSSHKKSEAGPRAKAEDRARKEIPLFLCLEAKKIL